MKRCSHCGEELPETEFYRRKGSRDGLDYWCKTCRKIDNMKHQEASQIRHKQRMMTDSTYREHRREYERKYRETHKKKYEYKDD